MVKKKDISLICIFGIFILGLSGTGSIYQSVMGIFNSFVYATKELMPTIFIISIIAAMSSTLMDSGISLVGSVSRIFSAALGGGMAAICGVDAFELARKNVKPVLIGLIVTTIVAIFIM